MHLWVHFFCHGRRTDHVQRIAAAARMGLYGASLAEGYREWQSLMLALGALMLVLSACQLVIEWRLHRARDAHLTRTRANAYCGSRGEQAQGRALTSRQRPDGTARDT